jgi:DNA-binding LacI/PurR family transcriptional regulator
MATIKDVAEMAGVSISTVSYAINGTRPISAEKKESILEAMRKLNYKRHAIARSLASKRTHIIAILFPPVEHGIGLSEIELILQAARSAATLGYHLVIWTLQTNQRDELEQLIQQGLVDGVILMEVHTEDKRIGILKKFGIPFILLGRDKDMPEETFIDVDFFSTMMQSITYLKELGHRHIIFINQSEKSYHNGYGPVVRSHEAFSYLCKNFDIEGREYYCDSDPALVFNSTGHILKCHPETTAFIVMNDRALPGLIKGIEKRRLRIPEDISIVSIVSSGGVSSSFIPSITVFEMNFRTLVDLTVAQLIAKVEGRYTEIPLRLIPCVLREGESTGRITKEQNNYQRKP